MWTVSQEKTSGWLPHYQQANRKEGCIIVVYNSTKLEIMIKKKKSNYLKLEISKNKFKDTKNPRESINSM